LIFLNHFDILILKIIYLKNIFLNKKIFKKLSSNILLTNNTTSKKKKKKVYNMDARVYRVGDIFHANNIT